MRRLEQVLADLVREESGCEGSVSPDAWFPLQRVAVRVGWGWCRLVGSGCAVAFAAGLGMRMRQ